MPETKAAARVICPVCGSFTRAHCDPVKKKYCGWRVCPRPTCRTLAAPGGRFWTPGPEDGTVNA